MTPKMTGLLLLDDVLHDETVHTIIETGESTLNGSVDKEVDLWVPQYRSCRSARASP
jgi:hypothetical protein